LSITPKIQTRMGPQRDHGHRDAEDGDAHPEIVPDGVLLQPGDDAHRDADQHSDRERCNAELERDRELFPDDVVDRSAPRTVRGAEVHPTEVIPVPEFDVEQIFFQNGCGLAGRDPGD
jgi:hypothetical protein